MGGIWFLSEDKNMFITGFNKVINKKGIAELWVTEITGSSRKIATGQKAEELEQIMLNIIWNNCPAIIKEGDKIGTNALPMEEVEE